MTPGTTLAGRYRLEEVLGQGGMGVVSRATDLRLGRQVAVKTVAPAVRAAPEGDVLLEQLEHEARLLAGLSHPNLAVVHDSFTESGLPWFVMEFVDGPDLEEAVAGGPGLARRRRWLEQLLDALEYLHGLHPPVAVRDLKPTNVLLAGQDTVKLIDFGIARALHRSAPTHHLLRGYGSPGYAPPEAWRGERLDCASDLYSLGALIAFVLTGEHPHPTPPATGAPALDALVRDLMATDPAHRPPGAGEVRRRLDEAWPPGGEPSRLVWRERAPQTERLGQPPGQPGPPLRWRDLP